MATETPVVPTPDVVRPGRAGRVAKDLVSRYSLVLVWIAMSLAFTAALPGVFAQTSVAKAVFGAQQPLVFLGLALVITLAVGEFDLSFAGIFGFAATVVPAMAVLHGWPVLAAVAAAFVGALLLGLINAVLVVVVGINSVIVTLGVTSLATGAAYYLSDATAVSGLDPQLSQISLGQFLGLPYLFWYGLVLVLIAAYVMSFTPLGRAMVFVGSNREVARLAGIDVQLFRFLAYLVSALLCALTGTLVATALGGFDPGSTNTYFLPTFSAVFLGTVAVVPGRFNPMGMFIAVYFLLTGIVGFQLLGYPQWVNEVFYGLALLVAVTVSHFVQRKTRA